MVASPNNNGAGRVPPRSAVFWLERAAQATHAGNLDESITCLSRAVAEAPDDASIHYNLGLSHRLKRQHRKAVAAYQRALALDPTMVDAVYNLGNALADLDELEQAIACYKQAIAMMGTPAGTYHNLARVLNDIGRWSEALAVCDQGLIRHPSESRLHRHAVLIEMLRPHRAQCRLTIDRALADRAASISDRQWLHTQLAIHFWVDGDLNASRRQLAEAGPQDPNACRTPVDKSRWVYHDYLTRLLSVAAANPEKNGVPPSDTHFVVGDSHCLGWAHRNVLVERESNGWVPRLIMGVKAHHLAAKKTNPFQVAFAETLLDMPPKSHVLVVVGEIDCRSDGGIFPYWQSRKMQFNLDEKIDADVSGFVRAVLAMAEPKQLRLAFCGVPAPRPVQARQISAGDRMAFTSVSRLFNDAVSKYAALYGCGFVDLHSPTVGKDGWADGRHHLDDFHLIPTFLEALTVDDGVTVKPAAPGAGVSDDLRLKGLRYQQAGELDRALECYEQWLKKNPYDSDVINNIGGIVLSMGHDAEALNHFNAALDINPGLIPAACNAGRIFLNDGRIESAENRFTHALAYDAHAPDALVGMGDVCRARGDAANAHNWYHRAIETAPGHPGALAAQGALLIAQGRLGEADATYAFAMRHAPTGPAILNGVGQLRMRQGRPDEAVTAFERALTDDPDSGVVLANAVEAAMAVCDWERAESFMQRLGHANEAAWSCGQVPPEPPFLALVRGVPRGVQQKISESWSEQMAVEGAEATIAHHPPSARPAQLTVGYLSHNFTRHPVGFQIRGLFAHHDRERFRIIGYSTAPPDASDVRRQIAAGCDAFVDISGLDHLAAADRIREDKVDLLVDLMGHTRGHRMAIAAQRPAPIQIAYMGFLGPIGAPFIDYAIADGWVVPPAHEVAYRESLIRMPYCYQVNDNGLQRKAVPMARADAGLPEYGLVYASFNNPQKIDRAVFTAWMTILRGVPDSVMWLQSGSPDYRKALGDAAEAMSVARDRLIFAETLALEDHLNRLGCADVALDTWRYNGGATTSNALWAGVPVVARLGDGFGSRMSASALAAVGLTELIADSDDRYVALATEMGRNGDFRRQCRQKLAEPDGLPLFDTARFTADLERAFDAVWDRWAGGKAPESIDLTASRSPRSTPSESL